MTALPRRAPRQGLDVDELFEPGSPATVLGLIRRKARQLIGYLRLGHAERADLEQELVLRLLQRLGAYDEARACWQAFLVLVVNRAAADIVRRWFSRRAVPEQVTGGFGADEVTVETLQGAEQRPDLQLDVRSVLFELGERTRQVALRLASMTLLEIASELRVSRSTVAREVARLRAAFRSAGLDGYVVRQAHDRAGRKSQVVPDTTSQATRSVRVRA